MKASADLESDLCLQNMNPLLICCSLCCDDDVCAVGEETLTDALTAAGQTYEEIAEIVAQQVHTSSNNTLVPGCITVVLWYSDVRVITWKMFLIFDFQ